LRKFSVALILIIVYIFSFVAQSFAVDSPVLGVEAFEEILDDIQRLHISNPDSSTLIQGAIEGMIDSLNDPYTVYMSPGELKDFKSSLDGNYVGVGIHLQSGEHYPEVVDTIENTPAEEAGIKPNDQIIRVDGVDTFDEPLGKVVEKIRGPEGTKVQLTIRRDGVEEFNLELVRAGINTPTVNWNVLDDGTGYIRVNTFGMNTAREFGKALSKLKERGVTELILDLRDNPGGMLEAAVRITGDFVEPGRVVVSTLDRNGNRQEYRTEGAPIGKGMHTAVLVNRNSASAAEILAGALQDYRAATLIGEQTYGKGTVQMVLPLEAGGALKLTVAEYHTPKDRAINGTGLNPDIQVITPELQMITAQHFLKPPEKSIVNIEAGKAEALVNGTPVQLTQTVLQYCGTTYLPLRFTFEALGYRVDWQPAGSRVKITGHGSDVIYSTGDASVVADGQVIPEAIKLLLEGGVTYIPLSELDIFDINHQVNGNSISIEKNFQLQY